MQNDALNLLCLDRSKHQSLCPSVCLSLSLPKAPSLSLSGLVFVCLSLFFLSLLLELDVLVPRQAALSPGYP